MDERLHDAAVHPSPVAAPAVPHGVASGLVLGLMAWSFGLPGAVLLAGLLVVAPVAASTWAWIFAGFWVLAAAAGRALDLAISDDP